MWVRSWCLHGKYKLLSVIFFVCYYKDATLLDMGQVVNHILNRLITTRHAEPVLRTGYRILLDDAEVSNDEHYDFIFECKWYGCIMYILSL